MLTIITPITIPIKTSPIGLTSFRNSNGSLARRGAENTRSGGGGGSGQSLSGGGPFLDWDRASFDRNGRFSIAATIRVALAFIWNNKSI
jgi:hypothetical protein